MSEFTRKSRVTVVSVYPPLPATDGGRLDVLNQLKALVRHGVEVQLVLVNDDRLSQADHDALMHVCASIVEANPQRDVLYWMRTAVLLLDRPLFVARRSFFGTAMSRIMSLTSAFDPDAILCESLDPAQLAQKLARRLGVRLFLRSQNIEHQYKADVVRQTRGIRRIRGILDRLHLRRFEQAALATSKRFFDISVGDLQYWRSNGLTNGVWLPPVFDTKLVSASNEKPEFDVGFIGNLHNHNNIRGLRWFVDDVLPLLDFKLGRRTRLLVAGSNPSSEARTWLDRPEIVLISNFDDLHETQHRARVLFNPMLTGGGVALKTVEMLRSGRPVVSTSRGAGGLPADIYDLISIADNAETFAAAIERALRQPLYDEVQARHTATRFDYTAILPLVEEISAARADRE